MTLIKSYTPSTGYWLDVDRVDSSRARITFLRSVGYGGESKTPAFTVEVQVVELLLLAEALQAHPEESFTLMIPVAGWSNAYVKFTHTPRRDAFGITHESSTDLTYASPDRGESSTRLKTAQWRELLQSILNIES